MSQENRPSLDEQLAAEERLYAEMFHTGDNKVLAYAVVLAIVVHIGVLFIRFPDTSTEIEEKPENVIVVKKYVPPPPKIERKVVQKKKLTRKVPVPDPTPDEPEPIREPEPEIEPEPLPPDVEFLIGTPDAPPPSGPLLAGVEGVTNPVLIDSSKVEPEFPELARVARIAGRVILQAVIKADGSVADATVLNCSRPGMGFEQAAVDAVMQWKYQPAKQGDRPVDVFFTVRLEFELN